LADFIRHVNFVPLARAGVQSRPENFLLIRLARPIVPFS
jgi:hypothetical protein